MKKERSFRPPQAVLNTVSRFDGDPDIVKLSGGAVPLSDLRKMHSFLRSESAIQKVESWEHQGGNDGLMWARRVLRQEGIIKRSEVGDIFIPDLADMQLGPTIILGHANEPMGLLVEKFQSEGIPASFIPNGDSTFVFFAGDASEQYEVSDGIPNLPDVHLGDMVLLEENQNRVNTLLKAAKDNVAGVQCKRLESHKMPIDASWNEVFLLKSSDNRENVARILKVDDELGLVMGWAIICTVDDQPYFDKQDDHIPDNGMLDAATDFMLNSRVAKEMHTGDGKGTVLFAWPMTAEIAKAFDIEVHQTGLMIAMKPDNPEMLEKFRDGTYNGFSIGGHRIAEFTEEVE